eukprot:gene8996-9076_t
MRSSIAGDLPAHPHMAKFILDPSLQSAGKFGHGKFGSIGQGGVSHSSIEPVFS